MSGYGIDSISAAVVTLPSSSVASLSFYSVDTSLYYTSGSVTGNLYALKADGSTKFTSSNSFSLAYTAPCASFTPMTGSATGTFTGSTYTIGQSAISLTFSDLELTSNTCVHSYSLTSVSPAMITMPDTSTPSLTIYSVDTNLWYTSGSVTGIIYAKKADGSTLFNTAGQFITFTI